MTIFAWSTAVFVPCITPVSLSTSSSCDNNAVAALALAMPNILVISAVSPITLCRGLRRSVRLRLLSVSMSISTPAASSSCWTFGGRNLPRDSIIITFRSATPPSAPFLPALSSTCIAALVSAKFTLAALAAMPAFSSASLICGSSAEPSMAAAAITFIILAISSDALIGSSIDT